MTMASGPFMRVLWQRIAADMREGGGLLTLADLVSYRVIEREPLPVDVRGLRLLTNPPPSFGGSLIALLLRLLEARAPADLQFGSPAHLALLVAAMEEADRRRASHGLSPVDLGRPGLSESLERVRSASGGTTHVSVCDAETGNAASMTISGGSGYFVPGTGVMLNNMMGEEDLHPEISFHVSPPGVRVASMMAPSLLLDGEQLRWCWAAGAASASAPQ